MNETYSGVSPGDAQSFRTIRKGTNQKTLLQTSRHKCHPSRQSEFAIDSRSLQQQWPLGPSTGFVCQLLQVSVQLENLAELANVQIKNKYLIFIEPGSICLIKLRGCHKFPLSRQYLQ